MSYRSKIRRRWNKTPPGKKRLAILKKFRETLCLAEDLHDTSMGCVTLRFRWLPPFTAGNYRVELHEFVSKRRLEEKSTIHLHIKSLLCPKFYKQTLENTIAHEIAHCVVFRKYGLDIHVERGHGVEFQSIFKSLGGTDIRYLPEGN